MLTRLFLGLFMFCVSLSSLADDAIAKIIKAQGDASALNESNQSRALARGDDVFLHDTVVTSPTGFVTLRFTDGTVIDLASSTKYVVKEYNYTANDPKKDKFSTEIVEGGFRAITGGIGTRSPAAFTAKARMTTLTVRGTYFYFMAPDCPFSASNIIHQICNDVVQFTIQGTTALIYKGTEYLLGPDSPNATFQLKDGTLTLSKAIPAVLPMKYSTGIEEFRNEVPVQTPGSRAKGGGGGTSPCGTLNAVGNALPSSAAP